MLENEFRVFGRLISYYRKLYKFYVNDFLLKIKMQINLNSVLL